MKTFFLELYFDKVGRCLDWDLVPNFDLYLPATQMVKITEADLSSALLRLKDQYRLARYTLLHEVRSLDRAYLQSSIG